MLFEKKLRKQVQAMVDNKELDGKDARTIFRDRPRKRSLLRGYGRMVGFHIAGREATSWAWQIVLLPFGQFGDVEEGKGGGQGGYASWDDR